MKLLVKAVLIEAIDVKGVVTAVDTRCLEVKDDLLASKYVNLV